MEISCLLLGTARLVGISQKDLLTRLVLALECHALNICACFLPLIETVATRRGRRSKKETGASAALKKIK